MQPYLKHLLCKNFHKKNRISGNYNNVLHLGFTSLPPQYQWKTLSLSLNLSFHDQEIGATLA